MTFDLLFKNFNIAPANLHNALRALPDFVSILVNTNIVHDKRVYHVPDQSHIFKVNVPNHIFPNNVPWLGLTTL